MIPIGGKKFLAHFASLLGTYLENPSGFLGHLGDLLAFLNGQCEWLFAINVLACLHRMDCDSRVPMVRRTNGYEVNVLALQNLSVVLVTFGFALGKRLVDAIDPLRVQVAYGDQIRQPAGVVGDSAPVRQRLWLQSEGARWAPPLRHSQGKGNRKRRKFRQGPFGRIGSESDDGKGLIYSWILSFEEYACFHQPSFTVFFVLFYGVGFVSMNEAYGTYGLFIPLDSIHSRVFMLEFGNGSWCGRSCEDRVFRRKNKTGSRP